MVTAVKNQSPPPQPTDDLSYDYDNYDTGGFEGYGDSYVSGDDQGEEAPAQPSTAGELRSRIQDLQSQLEASALPKGEMAKIRDELSELEGEIGSAQVLHSKNLAQFLAPIEAKLGNYEAKILGLDGADLPGGWGDDVTDKKVTGDDIHKLMDRINAGKQEPSEESGATKEDILKALQDALDDLGAGRQAAADAGYQKVLGAVGGLKDDKTIAEEDYGAKPDKIEGNKYTYDGKDQKNFTFTPTGEGKEIVVKDAESIEIKPSSKNTQAVVIDNGDTYTIQVGSDKITVPHDAKIRIFSDNVEGCGVDNTEGNITVGASSKTEQQFVDSTARNERADKLTNAAIGPADKGGVYGTPDETEMKNAKDILAKVADALREKDPAKRKELWEEASDAMQHIKSIDGRGDGVWNNTAQLIFDVMQGEFGESGMKAMLKDGTINRDFASSLASVLTCRTDENESMSEINGYQRGGLGLNHSDSANFLKQYSTTGAEED